MDNNFYEHKYERKSVNKDANNKQSFFTKVVAVQLVMSLLITGILYLVCRTDSELSENIKLFYAEISENDIAVSRLFDTMKNVVKQTFSPSVQNEEVNRYESTITTGERVNFSPDFFW